MENKLILKDVKLLFVEIKDKDFGSSITIDVTDDKIRKAIEDYYNAEGINPKFKEYTNKETGTVTKQYSIKLASFVKVQDEAGAEYDLDALETKAREVKFVFGSRVNVAIRAYEYDNKFGKGKSASVSAVKIVKGAEAIKDDMEDLM
ncbi:MAG: hypothetical protein J6S67_21640 [Methanobrevibacter sp.]|nr:hypothetical protein [Methanobrevibacter sp.]